MKWMLQNGMKIVRITAGVAIILIGMGLGFIPGIPGFPLVFVGLTILAVDFVWARRLKQRLKDEATKVMNKVRGKPTKEVGEVSVADELGRLSQLAKDGLLSPDEWVRAKEMFLGKSPNKREDALDSLQRLHDLYGSGALSQSEFNMKKWDILSRSDV